MGRFYIRPDMVMRTGVVRPAAESRDLHAEIQAIATAFTEDPSVIAQEYGPSMVANVPTAEVVPPPSPVTTMPVGPTAQMPGFVARFFGRK